MKHSVPSRESLRSLGRRVSKMGLCAPGNQLERDRDRQTDIQTDRQKDKQKEGQTERQTDRHGDPSSDGAKVL